MNISLTDVEAKRFLAERFDVSSANITIQRTISVNDTLNNLIELIDSMNLAVNNEVTFRQKIELIGKIRTLLGTDLSQAKELTELLVEEASKI